MKYLSLVCIVLISLVMPAPVAAQSFTQDLGQVNVDALSDEQVRTYWNKARSEGYSLDQLEVIAQSKGMNAAQFARLRQRISSLAPSDSAATISTDKAVDMASIPPFGLEGKSLEAVETNLLFGYDFFSNPNISFSPNINLPTPENYRLGPGDDLLIDVWGAAQNNYRKQVDREGAIRLENIGPVYVSGLSVDQARKKIISYLKKIYSGIDAPADSYTKVYTAVSLLGVRTVQVNIIGEVKVPGTYSLSALSTVLNALYAAGGPKETGSFRNIRVLRDGKELAVFDIYQYLTRGSEKGNVTLQDQDLLIVPPYGSKVTVEGEVKRPGLYELVQGETLETLTEFFGGFTAEAYRDLLLVTRINGSQKAVNEISPEAQSDFVLQDGDQLSVGLVNDRFQNRISIGGAVYRPGNYELTDGLSLSNLIDKAGGLRDYAFLERGFIFRSIDDIQQEAIPFSPRELLDHTTDLLLKREDSVQVFARQDLMESQTLTIDGAVNKPQTIPFVAKMRIEDLIALSGGFKEGADATAIDIARRVADGDFEVISKNIQYATSNQLVSQGSAPFFLEPFDRVSVRYLKGYTIQQNVQIQGEVAYPGTYSIASKKERVSDLLAKAGGFSPYAYVEGAYLLRKLIDQSDRDQLELAAELVAKDSLETEIPVAVNELKIGLNMEKIIKEAGSPSKYNILLEEGDVLYVPTVKQTVQVSGEVLAPALIRYDKNYSFKDYVNRSGGFSQSARKRNAYVIYANGEIRTTKRFLFFKNYPKLAPGALILIPSKAMNKQQKMSLGEIIGLTTSLGTLGVLIKTLSN